MLQQSEIFARMTAGERIAHNAALDDLERARALPISYSRSVAIESALKLVRRARAVMASAEFRPAPGGAAER